MLIGVCVEQAMLASGSKDSLVKLWDPKSGKCLFTIHGHKNAVRFPECTLLLLAKG